jgi:hypothetical protein
MSAALGPSGPADREAGAGTVLVIGLVAVVLTAAAAVGGLAGIEADAARSRAASDLGALAAATVVNVPRGVVLATPDSGRATACERARQVVGRNGADLTGCALLGDGVVEVTATVRTALVTTRTRSRAGPWWADRS